MKKNIKKTGVAATMALTTLFAQAQNTFPSTGNVGIGTLTPESALHVNGTIYAGNTSAVGGSLMLTGVYRGAGNFLNAVGSMYSSAGTMIGYALRPSLNSSINFLSSTDIPIGRAAITIDGEAFKFFTAPTQTVAPGGAVATTQVLTVFNNGMVRIGNTSTPAGYKLYVESGILSEKVKVAIKTSGDWADHVFQENYKLMPLEQVAQFIQRNKHLPGIPSAAEMVKEGNDLGKTDARLLEKIEELTLYLIELKNENRQMQQKIAALEAKNQ